MTHHPDRRLCVRVRLLVWDTSQLYGEHTWIVGPLRRITFELHPSVPEDLGVVN